jgi:lipopolysaccharide biosynthesis glycosyltransferase
MAEPSQLPENVVVLCTDARFILPCAFVLDQLAADPQRDRYDVVVVHDDVGEADLSRLVARSGRPISTVAFDPRATQISGAPTNERLTRATYIRLYLDALLPPHYRRILYLDSDISLDPAGIARLFEVQLGGHAFAAARDGIDIALLCPDQDSTIPHTWRSHEEMKHYKAGLGLGATDPYVNAGILLIDRRRWVEEALSERVLAFATAHPERCQLADQSALNAVKGERWAELSPRWNFQPIHAVAALRKVMDPYVHHFAGAYKPWNTEIWGKRYTEAYRSWQAETGWPGSFPPGPTMEIPEKPRQRWRWLRPLGRPFSGAAVPAQDPFGPERRAEVREGVLAAMTGRRFVDLQGDEQRALIEAVSHAR